MTCTTATRPDASSRRVGLLGYQALGVRTQTTDTLSPVRSQVVPRGWRRPVARPVDDHCGGPSGGC